MTQPKRPVKLGEGTIPKFSAGDRRYADGKVDGFNLCHDQYTAYLADLVKEVREAWVNGSREDLYEAIRTLIERIDK